MPVQPSPLARQGLIFSPSSTNYHNVLDLQREFCRERIAERRPDTLVLVEHPPVFTIGRRAQPEHCGNQGVSLRQMGYDVYEVERGGSVTYHGPGQIVGYPILRLKDYCAGPKLYVRMLEEVIIRVLNDWEIKGTRVVKLPGVWVAKNGGEVDGQGEWPIEKMRKIAAIGVRIARGVTFHGFALNVSVDVKPFEFITPCGIEGCQVTSMQRALGKSVDCGEVRSRITHHFGEVFGLEWNN